MTNTQNIPRVSTTDAQTNAYLKVVGIVRREVDGKHFYIVEGTTLAGAVETILIPREDSNPKRTLKSRGFIRDTFEVPREKDVPLTLEAAQVGFRSARKQFVTHFDVKGRLKGACAVAPPAFLASAVTRTLKRQGTLESFRREVAPFALTSSAAMLSLCCSFAAPLLTILKMASFGLVLVGPTRCGKSSAQLVAASTIGYGHENELVNLMATDNGLLEAALLFRDHLFPINEIATATQKKTDVYNSIFKNTYALMSGRDKLRFSAYNLEMGANSNNTFSSIFLLSSERSPDEWAALAGVAREEGEKSRMIGVPVVRDGFPTIHDRPPKGLAGQKLQEWTQEQFRRMRLAVPKNRGQAFADFAEYLTADRTRARKAARRHVKHFERSMKASAKTDIDRQIVKNFAVVYAGGAIASKAGVLPFSRAKIERAIGPLCRAAIGELPDRGAELRHALKKLRFMLRPLQSKRAGRPLKDATGYMHDDRKTFVVTASAFSACFRTLKERHDVLMWLWEKGYLKGTMTKPKKETCMEWAQSQVTWPDRTRKRSVQIFLPEGLDDLLLEPEADCAGKMN